MIKYALLVSIVAPGAPADYRPLSKWPTEEACKTETARISPYNFEWETKTKCVAFFEEETK